MKRGVLAWLLILLIPICQAAPANFTTEGKGYLLIYAPSEVIVGEEFEISGTYFFTNQLLRHANVTLRYQTVIYYQNLFEFSEDPSEFVIALQEDQEAVYTYILEINEASNLDEEFTTEIPLTVAIVSDQFEDEKVMRYWAIDVDNEELTFDDLSAYEPPNMRGNIHYTAQKNINTVNCQLQDNLVIFLASDEFRSSKGGEAECIIKGDFEGEDIIEYTYRIFVGTASEIEEWGKADIVPSSDSNTDTDQSQEYVTEESDTYLHSDLVNVDVRTDPPQLSEGETGTIIIEVETFHPEIEGIGSITVLIDGMEGNQTEPCNNQTTCTYTYSKKFLAQGLNFFSVFVDLNPTAGFEYQEDFQYWPIQDQSDTLIMLANANSNVMVYAKQQDIDVPIRGVLTDPTSVDDSSTAKSLLIEYQRKKRIPVNFDEEIKKMGELAKYLKVEKDIWPVTVVNNKGIREEHTKYRIKLIPNKPTIMDYLLGLRTFKNLSIYEHIAKESAVDLGHIRFDNGNYEIINEDPLVVWHFDEIDSETEISYDVDKVTENQGNTLVIGEAKRGFPNIVFAIILIPIIILALIYFDRFKKSPAGEIEELKDKPPDYSGLEEKTKDDISDISTKIDEKPPEDINNMGDFDKLIDSVEAYIVKRLNRGEPRDHIKQELTKANWPGDIVEKLIEKHEIKDK
ncbi:MAG: hypothetical protein KKG59_07750 [Nanoarchaeota archaeon]|nr:hypothetical protein [Nanoarchaeota archaeon]